MQNGYYVSFGNFGWTNVDRFIATQDPKHRFLCAPEGYDNTNSAIYLSYDGKVQMLAKLDTFTAADYLVNTTDNLVGLACHIIFVTEENGHGNENAIKGVTITSGAIQLYLAETTVGTEAN
jgi:hypothetical protein